MQNLKGKERIKNNSTELLTIPNKLYFSIGEVSQLCDLKPHILRYWENEFSQLKPTKRRGNRRYYQVKEVLLIRRIRSLLYEKGFTIEGARQQLQENPEPSQELEENHFSPSMSSLITRNVISETINQLEQLVQELENSVITQLSLPLP